MDDLSVFNLDLSEQTQVDEQVFGILGDYLFHFFKNVVKNDLAGLFFHLC